MHTDCLDVAGPGTGWLLNVPFDLPLANRGADFATKTPDLVATKVRDENFVTILICLDNTQSYDSALLVQSNKKRTSCG